MEILGMIIAIVLVIYLAMKGFNIVFVAPVASIIVIITNGMDFFPSLIGTEEPLPPWDFVLLRFFARV